MYNYENQKEMRSAINGKMIVMVVGMFLIITAVTTTLLQAFQYLYMANAANGGMQDAIDALAQAQLSIGQVVGIGVAYVITGIVQVVAGIVCVKFSNRLDKVKLCLYMDGLLFLVVILQQVYLMLLLQTLNPFGMLSGLVMPAFLLWAITRLMKLAKKYPDRKFAVEPNPARNQRKATAQAQPKKNLMEKAKAQVSDEELAARVAGEIPLDDAKDVSDTVMTAEVIDDDDVQESGSTEENDAQDAEWTESTDENDMQDAETSEESDSDLDETKE